ncbi:MAG: hypothetical protein ACREDP_12370 [Bradyrhizobium sp.]
MTIADLVFYDIPVGSQFATGRGRSPAGLSFRLDRMGSSAVKEMRQREIFVASIVEWRRIAATSISSRHDAGNGALNRGKPTTGGFNNV